MKINQRGFTIIELMIATSVFSVVLLIASNGIVQIGRLYYKGLVTTRTQEVVRATVADISNSLQLTDGTPIRSLGGGHFATKAICIGENRYTYQIDRMITEGVTGHALWLDDQANGACVPADLTLEEPSATGRELLGTNMRLLEFAVEPPSAGETLYNVRFAVAYGASDLLTHYDNNSARIDLVGADGVNEGDSAAGLCKTGVSGNSFCAVSALDSSVKKRLL